MGRTWLEKKMKFCKTCGRETSHQIAAKSRGAVYHIIAICCTAGLLYLFMGTKKAVWTCTGCGSVN